MSSLKDALLTAGVKPLVVSPIAPEIKGSEAGIPIACFSPDVEVMYLQFSFGNRNRLPRWLWQTERETPVERQERKSKAEGVQIIERTPGVSLSSFVDAALGSDLWLVNAFEIPRIDPKNSKNTYYMVRFSFARRREGLSEEFVHLLDTRGADALRGMVRDTWRVRAYRNPLLHEGVPVPGKFLLSVNCAVPAPRNGKPASAELLLESGWPTVG